MAATIPVPNAVGGNLASLFTEGTQVAVGTERLSTDFNRFQGNNAPQVVGGAPHFRPAPDTQFHKDRI